MAKNRMTFEKTQRENKKRQKAAQKRVDRQARKDQPKTKTDTFGVELDEDPVDEELAD